MVVVIWPIILDAGLLPHLLEGHLHLPAVPLADHHSCLLSDAAGLGL